jgi:hypothetical protein
MHGRMIHGLPVLGSMAHIESIAARHGIDEVLISSNYASRIPAERLDQLNRYGVPVRVLGDEQGSRCGSAAEDPFGDLKVIIAGNGPIVTYAARAAKSAGLVILTDDPSLATVNQAERQEKESVYLGLLEDRTAVIRTVREISPDIVVADLDVFAGDIANPIDAWLRKVVLPLERLAAGAVAAGSRMVLVSRRVQGADQGADRQQLFTETVVRDVFRSDPEHLAVLRDDGSGDAAMVSRAVERLAGAGGGIWRMGGSGNTSGGDPEILDTDPVPENVSGILIEMSRALADGDAGRIEIALSEFSSLSRAGRYEGA